MKKNMLYISVLLIIAFANMYSQETSNSDNFENYGIFTNYNYQIHNSDFKRLPGIPNCCPEFTSGYSKGFSIGGVYQYLFPVYGFEFRAGLDFFKGNFTSSEDMVFAVNDIPVYGKFDHIIDFDLNSLSIESLFKYKITDKINVSLGLGLSFFLSSSFNQVEKISSPEGKIYFLDSNGRNTFKSTRNERSGEIPDLNVVQANTMFKIGYDVYLKKNKSLILRPELGLNYYFSNMVKDLDWHTMSIKFGITVLYSTRKSIVFESENEIPIEQQLSQIKSEVDELKNKNEKINNDKKILEELLKKEQAEKDSIAKYLTEKEKLLTMKQDSVVTEQKRIENERDDFNKMIDAENKKAGRICKCYVILFNSTNDKNEADKLFESLKNKGIVDINITIFVEPYLKEKYYRILSKCYADPSEAFDYKLKIQSITNVLNIVPQILCNK